MRPLAGCIRCRWLTWEAPNGQQAWQLAELARGVGDPVSRVRNKRLNRWRVVLEYRKLGATRVISGLTTRAGRTHGLRLTARSVGLATI